MRKKIRKQRISVSIDRSVRLDGTSRENLQFGEKDIPFTAADVQDELDRLDSFREALRDQMTDSEAINSDER